MDTYELCRTCIFIFNLRKEYAVATSIFDLLRAVFRERPDNKERKNVSGISVVGVKSVYGVLKEKVH